MIKTYTYKVKTNRVFECKFKEWLGITRYVYNLGLEVREESYKKGVIINHFNLSKQLTEAKKEFEWLRIVNAQTFQAILERLEDGYKKFFADVKRGKTTSKPKWAKKDKWKSLPFKSIKTTPNGFILPSFGKVKVFNFKSPKGELRTATLIQEADGIYLKIVVREEVVQERENQPICAIDMGITYFMTTSDGEFIENPRHLFSYLKELRVENRKLSRMKKGGNNWKKQVKVLQLLHQKVSRVRKDFLHKQSRYLANNYSTVIREDLQINKMIKGSKLAKHISDCSWGLFFELIKYKTNVIKVNPKYTSQECSKCGHTCKENRRTQSLFECVKCGHTDNADLNAAYNILQRGQSLMEANVGQ